MKVTVNIGTTVSYESNSNRELKHLTVTLDINSHGPGITKEIIYQAKSSTYKDIEGYGKTPQLAAINFLSRFYGEK